MKPSICKENDLDISIPEACDYYDWLIPVNKVEDIEKPNRHHAYITPENDVYLLAHNGKQLTKISNHQLWDAIQKIKEEKEQMQNQIVKKADKAAPVTEGNVAILASDGNYLDSNIALEDVVTLWNLKNYETIENKVALSSTATSEQYPNAKSVYDYVQSQTGSTIIFAANDVASGVLSYTIPFISRYKMLIVRCGASMNNSTTVAIPLTSHSSTYATTAFITNDPYFSAAAAMRLIIDGSTLNLTTHWSTLWQASNLRIYEIFGVS